MENAVNPTTIKPANVTMPAKAPQKVTPPVPKPTSTSSPSCTSPDHQKYHHQKIAECAYFIAKKRNFSAGDQVQDWLTAEDSICNSAP
jgi:hypothetical protein